MKAGALVVSALVAGLLSGAALTHSPAPSSGGRVDVMVGGSVQERDADSLTVLHCQGLACSVSWAGSVTDGVGVVELPACVSEDGSGGPTPCVWDASTRENGEGRSFVVG